MNINTSPSYLTLEQQVNENNIDDQSPFSRQFLSGNSMQNHTTGYCDHQLYQPQHHQQDDNFGRDGGSSNKIEMGFRLTLWREENHLEEANYDHVKWVPRKIRLMKNKTKNKNIEDSKSHESCNSTEADLSGSISFNNPIRVCSDCNTTKTPLWRSGPKGPKSLCNACGIRQRKARRAAMVAAAAAAAADRTAVDTTTSATKKHKDQKIIKKGNASDFKKHCKMAAFNGASSSNRDMHKKLDLEDFLINLSKNLAFQLRVFPQDEKDAAILLMALSSGLVHG